MRKVKDKNETVHEVHARYMLSNGWEFYQLDKTEDDGVAFGYMDGCPYPELGYSDTNQFTCLAVGHGDELHSIDPPIGWAWNDEVMYV